ncbi:protein kinase [Myxococcaceae bacterium GXIMD 01537]
MASYRLVRRLASGGMAEVFLAKVLGAEGFEKPVAVKRVLPSLVNDREFVELFLREARLTVSLQHANIVQVFDLGAVRGQYYMVMEFVDGENLRALQRSAMEQRVPLGLREVCFIVQQVTEGLAYAHEKADPAGRPLGIVHRDVNPSNVMVSATGEVKLADFGIAKAANVQGGTQVGVVKGKMGYLAPEQVRGGPADQRADLFLIGLLLYELLAGRPLFGGPDYFQTLRNISNFDVKSLVPVAGVPAPLWGIVTRALAPEPDARYQRARELADALQHYLFENRLSVGRQDVARLFARSFPHRRSPLEEGMEGRCEDIRLGSDPAVSTPPSPRPIPPPRSASRPELTRPLAPPRPPPQEVPRPAGPQPLPPRTATRPELQRPQAPPVLLPQGAAEPPRRPAFAQGPVTEIVRRPPQLQPTSAPANAVTVPLRVRPVRRRLGEMLVASGLLTEVQLTEALARQRREAGRLGERLVAEGLVTEEDVVLALGEQAGIPVLCESQLRAMEVPSSLLGLLPLEHAERFEAVPLALHGKELVCALREPQNLERLDELQFITGCVVRGIFASAGAIHRAIARFYRGEEALAAPGHTLRLHAGAPVEPLVAEPVAAEVAWAEPAPEGPVTEALVTGSGIPRLAPRSLARPFLVVSDDEQQREAALLLFASQGVTAVGCNGAEAEQVAALGGVEVVLVAADALTDAPALVGRLAAAAPSVEVRLVPSLAEALAGDAGPLGRSARLHARVLEAALAALGGVGVLGASLGKLARRLALRLGAGSAEAERAAAMAYAVACAARMEGLEPFVRPMSAAVRAVLGSDAGEVAEFISVCEPNAVPAPSVSRAALALAGTVALMEAVGSSTLTPDAASQALVELRASNMLPGAAMEALAAEVAELVLGDTASCTVVLAEPDASRAATLQARFLSDGVRVLLASSGARARQLLSEGSQALVVASHLPDGDGAALTRALRATAATAHLPIFVLAPQEDPSLVEAGLEAGADDVLTYPVNPDVLAAKLRRALQPRRAVIG